MWAIANRSWRQKAYHISRLGGRKNRRLYEICASGQHPLHSNCCAGCHTQPLLLLFWAGHRKGPFAVFSPWLLHLAEQFTVLGFSLCSYEAVCHRQHPEHLLFKGLLAQEEEHKSFLCNNSSAQDFVDLFLQQSIFVPWRKKNKVFSKSEISILPEFPLVINHWEARDRTAWQIRKRGPFARNRIHRGRKTQATLSSNPVRNFQEKLWKLKAGKVKNLKRQRR